MLKIGEFSKLSRVSVRMLRHYDEIGLLKPAEIDRFTDYRYYREDQLPIVCRITALKDMGFSLADIVSNSGNLRRPGTAGAVFRGAAAGAGRSFPRHGAQADASGRSPQTG